MAVSSTIMEQIIAQAIQLPFGERLHLVHELIDTLKPSLATAPPQYLIYGQFRGSRMSTMEDFRLAEWQPTEAELNGA